MKSVFASKSKSKADKEFDEDNQSVENDTISLPVKQKKKSRFKFFKGKSSSKSILSKSSSISSLSSASQLQPQLQPQPEIVNSPGINIVDLQNRLYNRLSEHNIIKSDLPSEHQGDSGSSTRAPVKRLALLARCHRIERLNNVLLLMIESTTNILSWRELIANGTITHPDYHDVAQSVLDDILKNLEKIFTRLTSTWMQKVSESLEQDYSIESKMIELHSTFENCFEQLDLFARKIELLPTPILYNKDDTISLRSIDSTQDSPINEDLVISSVPPPMNYRLPITTEKIKKMRAIMPTRCQNLSRESYQQAVKAVRERAKQLEELRRKEEINAKKEAKKAKKSKKRDKKT